MLLPERCLEGCQHHPPPALPGPSCRIWCWATVTRPQRPNCRWATDQPGVDEEAVARQVWVLPRSDVSSAWVMQQSQQWSLRQTWARCAEFGVSGDVTARACAKTGGERSRHPCRGLCRRPALLWHVGALRAPTAARIVTLRARGLASLGAWALGERGGALGERWRVRCVERGAQRGACVACCAPCGALVARTGSECGAGAAAEDGRCAAGASNAARLCWRGAGEAGVGVADGGSGRPTES